MTSTAEPNPKPTPPKSPRRSLWPKSWIARIALGAVALVVVVLLLVVTIGPIVVRSVIREQLQAAVAGNLNATLEIDDLTWHPLLGVSIGHARLIGKAPDGSPVNLVELGGLDVNLAHIPSSAGPIVVQRCIINDPVIDLVRLPSGEFQVQQGLIRASSAQPSSLASAWKPSALVQVQHFELNDLTVRESDFQSSAPPQVWGRLDVTADLATAPSGYQFHIALANAALAKLDMKGSVDIDNTSLTFSDFSLTAQVPADTAIAQIPAELQPYCKQYNLAGAQAALTIANGATLSVDLAKGHWSVRGLNGDLKITTAPPAQVASGRVAFAINTGGPLPSGGTAIDAGYLDKLDPDTRVSILTDQADGFTINSSRLPAGITQATGDIELANRTALIKGLTAHYGSHVIQLDTSVLLGDTDVKLKALRLQLAGGAVLVDSADVSLTAPYDYSANLSYTGIDLSEVRDMAQLAALGNRLGGTASGDLRASGTLPPTGLSPLVAVQGDGDFNVVNGDFFDMPVLAAVAGKVSPDLAKTLGNTTRVGEAAGVFTFTGGTLHFSQLAVSAPVLGIQGNGKVSMINDNPVDLNLVVAPLGDWKKQLNQTGIPLLGQLVGTVQSALNNVSRKVLYSFNVTGPAAHPSIVPKAAPALTADANNLFGQMIKGGGNLLDAVRPKTKPSPGN